MKSSGLVRQYLLLHVLLLYIICKAKCCLNRLTLRTTAFRNIRIPIYEPVSTDMVIFTHMIDMNVLNALGLYSVSQKLLPPMFSDNISPND